jgi:predicted ATPase
MPFMSDIFDIPTQVHQGDFVLRLTEGVERPADTLSTYVVTPQLVICFDQALSLIKSALETRSSKGAYLHGSFGSGKSHFMAVLTLLLQRHPRAGVGRRQAQCLDPGAGVPGRALSHDRRRQS